MKVSELEKLLSAVREKQAKQIAAYESQSFFVGEPMKIPWEGELPVRFYINRPTVPPQGKMGVFLNLHGGGFIEGDAKLMGTFCQKLADRLGIFVVNVNYRLAPDHLYPYQCQEIDAIYAWLEENASRLGIDLVHCGIGGFSAGATIALNSVARCLQRGEKRYSCCVLAYPYVSGDPAENDAESAYQAGDETMMRVLNYYFNGRENEPECSLLNADEVLLSKFPGVVEITCAKDSLGRQGRKLAAMLAMAGVRLDYKSYTDALHGFIEVNRDDYDPNDPRRSSEQAAFCEDAEEFIIRGLASML